MLQDWINRNLLPDWANDRSPDECHPHRRRFTSTYRRKRGIVKSVWICSGIVMACQASLVLIITLTLGTTFLSFVILDESQ
jgi:ubiquinone biosynthesis protein COQ9